jgi:uncharacterized protein YdaU (DUF1376 family)
MSRPWMSFWVGDYLADTAHLRVEEHGAYMLLIMHYWRTGGLPSDEHALQRITRMTKAEWKRSRDVLRAFFQDGWRHKRIDHELAEADRISAAGRAGGKASGEARRGRKVEQPSNDAPTIDERPANDPSTKQQASQSQSLTQKDSEPNGSGASAPIDHRKRLFDEGLPKLARLTGKGPDACRGFVAKCLKAASDDAVTVLGLIDEAERNQVVDPSSWIAARLKPLGKNDGRRTVHEAGADLHARLAAFDDPAPGSLRGGEGEGAVRLLPAR